jgi:copper chaperone CopZ
MPDTNTAAATTTTTTTITYRVSGMTCQHCVNAVTAEITKLDGVTGVEVELPSGDVTVTSAVELSEGDIRAAVDEAGYELS